MFLQLFVVSKSMLGIINPLARRKTLNINGVHKSDVYSTLYFYSLILFKFWLR